MIPGDKIQEAAEEFSQGYAMQEYGFREGANWAQEQLKDIVKTTIIEGIKYCNEMTELGRGYDLESFIDMKFKTK
jgi:hypothetical protein